MNQRSLFALEDLQFTYNQKGGDFSLGPLTFEIASGKLTAILGRSGSGKTTLLSLLGLLRSQFSGKIHISLEEESYTLDNGFSPGFDADQFRANHIGFALQRGELLPYLSLQENAALLSRFLNKEQDSNIYKGVYQTFRRYYKREEQDGQLEALLQHKPSNVSQGQYQRGAIVRALATKPPIIMADEPTGNLDEHTGDEAMRLFRDIVHDSSATSHPQSVIVVTHDLHLAIKFSDEIIVLKNGRKQSQYTRHEIHDWLSEEKLPITKDEIYLKIRQDLK